MRLAQGLTVVLALTASASLYARDIDFNYVDVNVGIFDLDADQSRSDGADSISAETDTDSSFYASGAWQPYQGSVGWFTRIHAFAAAGIAKNDLDGSATLSGVTSSASGDLEVIQARFGVGYHQPLLENLNVYGRITYDYIELKDIDLGGVSFDDVDESGTGLEAGARWLFADRFELQGYVRWSDAATLSGDGGDKLNTDDGTFGGVAGRWYFADHWALQVNGEYGETALYGAGVRFTF